MHKSLNEVFLNHSSDFINTSFNSEYSLGLFIEIRWIHTTLQAILAVWYNRVRHSGPATGPRVFMRSM